MLKRCSNLFLVVAVSLLINVTLFFMIPFLSQIKETKKGSDFIINPTYVTKERIKPEPKKKRPQEEKKKPKPKPETVPKKVVKPKPLKKARPKIRVDMPQFDFQLSEIEAQSVPIAAPERPAKPSPPQPVKQSKTTYQLGEVDQNPQLIHRVRPTYPYQARRREITGRVVIKFLVDSQGNVTRASVIEASPKGVFEKNAISAVKKWRFKPGYYQGEAVKTWVKVPITFELSE